MMARVWLLVLGAFAIMASAITLLIVVPHAMLSTVKPPPELKPYTARQLEGRGVYIANGCLYCHSQQVRDPAFTTDVDRGWGSRGSVPADYYYDRPHLMGTMRTGPDLFNVGIRLPSEDWHLIHLYDPRAINTWSIMPGFAYLFEEKRAADVRPGDRVVNIPGPRAPKGVVVVAKPEAIALVDYLISLKHDYPVSDSAKATERMVGDAPAPTTRTTAVAGGANGGR